MADSVKQPFNDDVSCCHRPAVPLMNRIARTSALSFALLWVGVASAQTGGANPQGPTRSVESVRPLAEVKADAVRDARLSELGYRVGLDAVQPGP